MTIISSIALAAALALTTTAAKPEKSKVEQALFDAKVKSIVAAVALEQEIARRSGAPALTHSFDDDCPHPGGGNHPNGNCVDSVCAHLGNYGCDDQSEISQVLEACRGNYNGGCVDSVCAHLGNYGCDDMSEILQVTQACHSNYNSQCIDSACAHLGNYGCDDMSEITQVANACRGNRDSSCVESVCSRLGNYGCDDMSEILSVLRECSGQ